MIYAVLKNKSTKEVSIEKVQNIQKARENIEKLLDKFDILAIFSGKKLSFNISWEDIEEVVVRRKPKIDIQE